MLFDAFTLGKLTLRNRLVMAPMTRNRATAEHDTPGNHGDRAGRTPTLTLERHLDRVSTDVLFVSMVQM